MSRPLLVACCDAVSFRLLVKNLSRLFPGFSDTDVILVSPRVKQKWSVTFPFRNTKDLDFEGVKLVMSCSSPWRSHLQRGTDVVVTVRSSMNALIGGCWVPDLDSGLLHYFRRLHKHIHGQCKQGHRDCTAGNDALLYTMPVRC